MDQERFDELDLFDLDPGDLGLPPVEELEPGPERRPSGPPPATDPALPLLMPVVLTVMVAFGGLSMAIMSAGGDGGPAVAWLLGGAFAVLYVLVFWAGSLLIARHRR